MTRAGQRLELTWFNKDKALIPTAHGKYDYRWVDPRDPRYCETHTLVYDEYVEGTRTPVDEDVEYSDRAGLEPTRDNLLIVGESGDVLEALTRVPELSDRYVGQVKLCYIDPPFNTSKAFRHYEDNLEHSVWLTLMRDRLRRIKDLLSADGSIWVHLDDSENHRMRVLLDQVFGPGNFMAEVVWQKADSPRSSSHGFSDDHDVILVYRKSALFEFNRFARTDDDNRRFDNPDDDPAGPWFDGDPTANKGDGRGGMCYAIQNPLNGRMNYPGLGRHWSLGQDQILAAMNDWAPYRLKNINDVDRRAAIEGVSPEIVKHDVKALVLDVSIEEASRRVAERRLSGPLPLYLIRSKGTIGRKMYVPTKGHVPRTWWTNDEVDHNRGAKSEITALFPGTKAFATPKPERLLERIIHIATGPGDIVLDVFAGSGTTAATAHKMGRRWVTCELQASTVDDFTKPRLTKVVNDQDPGGITTTTSREAVAELPGDLTPDEAKEFNRLFTKVAETLSIEVDVAKEAAKIVRRQAKDDVPLLHAEESTALLRLLRTLGTVPDATTLDLAPDLVRQVRKATKTRDKTVVNFRGGGGFRVAHLSPACFDFDPELGIITLTPAAFDGDTLARAVAAALNFSYTPTDPVFTGRRGRMRLAVTSASVTQDLVDHLVACLADDEKLTLAATAVDPSAAQALRRARKGSRVVHIPNGLFEITGTED